MDIFPRAPLLTDKDDTESSEGGIDPLGTEPIADELGIALSPGVRERQSHPRFLTTTCVSLSLCEDYPADAFARDGVTPPWLVFEWYVVDGLVRSFGNSSKDVAGLPGRNKAALALKDGVPLSPRRYLKTPSVFGFHGIYRLLARTLGIEQNGSLGERGYELLQLWAKEQSLEGFLGTRNGPGTRVRQQLRDALRLGLDQGAVARGNGWEGWNFFGQHLAPYEFGRRERRFLADALLDDQKGFRREVLQFLVSERGSRVWLSRRSERRFQEGLRDQASPALRRLLRAIDAYEGFSRLIQDAFDDCLYEMTRKNARIFPRELGLLPSVKRAARQVPQAFARAADCLASISQTALKFQQAFANLAQRQSAHHWTQQLLEHHRATQKQKPPDGKVPWFELYDNGSCHIRPLYWRHEPARNDRSYVHFYRTFPLWSFAMDLKMVRR
jgi:hypothetical protein